VTKLPTPSVAFETGDDIAGIVGRWGSGTPDRPALIQGSRVVTWGELDARVARAGAAFASSGIGRGRRVAVLAQNSVEYVEVFFGALRARASVVTLPTMASSSSLSLMLADCTAAALFASTQYRDLALSLDLSRVTSRVGFDFEADGFLPYATFMEAAPAGAANPALDGDDEFDVLYSSGTTGVPKGIIHSHAARKASYAGARARYFSNDSVNVVATPFYSNTTCVTWLLATAAGGTNVILSKFSPEAFLDAVEKHRATHAMLVPVQYDRILDSPAFSRADKTSLKFLFSTSAPLRAETKRRILDELPAELIEIYGLTEGGAVAVLDARAHPDKLASVGRPAGSELRILDEQGRDVKPGQTGEVVGRASSMMGGYLNRPEETAELLWYDADGKLYFRTGDLGRFDEDGFLYLLDRKKDVIISGGFNVYATDLESVLAAHPDVLEVTVIGVPSDRWGETPLALVVPRPGASPTTTDLVTYTNDRVGKAQRLSGVELRSELPKNAIGKILKRELRAAYWPQK
jgi:acyl-CoA synthetase (AMP-forming)/AMP-acid ligase II